MENHQKPQEFELGKVTNRPETEENFLNRQADDKKDLLKKEQVNSDYGLKTTAVGVLKLYYYLSNRYDVFLMCLGALGSCGAGISQPLFAVLFGSTLSGYGAQQNITPSAALFNDTIGKMVQQFLIVGASMFVSFSLMSACWTLVGMRQMHRMKELYFRALMKQEQAFFDYNNAFEFSTKVQAQIKQVEGGVGEKFGTVLMMCSQVVAGLVIAFTTSWALSLIILGVAPFMVLCAVLMGRAMKMGIVESRKAYEKAGGIAEEIMTNIKTVASFANFKFEIERFRQLIDDTKQLGIKNGLKLGLGMGGIYLFMFTSYCIAVIAGSRFIVDKTWNANAGRYFMAGDVMTVIFATVMAVSSLGGMAPNVKAIGEATIAASDFFTLQERQSQIDEKESVQKPSKDNLTGKINIQNVTFTYPLDPNKQILKGMNLTFEPGMKIALVGESGSGKSTIINLVERLYDPDSGSIELDGINIKKFNIDYLRSLIGYVQQEPVLFNKSIKENIIFGRENFASSSEELDKLVKEACDDAYASDFIDEKPGKLEYIVGIKGSKLSGGQKQRVAIARAILAKPKILLLDEATSALDNVSEKWVQQAIDNITAKKVTTIIIAHRLSTIKNADKIYAIRNGLVIEEGTHKSLLEKNGYYAGLVKSQIIGEELNELKIVQNIKQPSEGNLIQENADEERPQVQFAETQNIVKPEGVLVEQKSPKQEEQSQSLEKPNSEINRSKLFSFLSENKCDIFLASLGSAGNGCIFPIYGLVLATAVNALSSTDPNKVLNDGVFVGLMFLIIAVGAGVSTLLQNFKFTKIGEVLAYKLRLAVFSHYLSLHMGFFDIQENSPGALLTKLSIDTTLLNGVILTVIGVSVQTLVCSSLGLGFGFAYDWRLALIVLAFFPFIIISGYLQQKLRRGYSSGDDKLDIEAGSILSECVINTKTIYSYNFQETGVSLYLDVLRGSEAAFTKQCLITGFLFGLGQFSLFAAFATVFYAGGKFILNGSLNFDNMTRAIMAILFSAFGVGIAQQYVGDFVKARNAFASLFSTLDLKTNIDTSEEANLSKASAEGITGKIEFRNVTFAYPTRHDFLILNDLTFTIEPGQNVAFVGYSGSGKSTIISLLERFYDVEQGHGEILIDGRNIKDYNLLSLRNKVGLVSQEPCLFKKRSVKENIKYGNFEATDEQIRDAAVRANISKFFGVGEDGKKETDPSGGEKQRIAIARAFIKNPQILLLDEATSALDKDSEDEVQKALNQLRVGKSITTITIAHRLSTVENCDVIYVLEGGRIAEKGTHKQLYNMKGRYYTLHKYSSS